jgi:hypothetical protein
MKHIKFLACAAVTVSGLALGSAAFAQSNNGILWNGIEIQPTGQVQPFDQATKNVTRRVFDEAQRAVIEEYFGMREVDQNSGYRHDHDEDEDNEDEDDDDEGHGHHGHGHGHGRGHGGGLPPGLAKKDHLPPGLEKQLERNGHLPPGLEKRTLPSDLASRLPPVSSGTERVLIGDNVVLLDRKSQLILDIVRLSTGQ